MQSGYGGVSEIQQFMVDGCSPPSLFSITTPTPPPPNPNAAEIHHQQQNLYHFHHHHHQQQQQQQQQQHHFSHLIHPTPITQQLFHHPHQFQLFLQHHHHQQLGLHDHHDASPEPSDPPASAPGPSFLAPAMGFKLGAADDSSAGGILRGDVDDGSESRLHSWHREEEESAATIKQPFWRPLDIDYINRNNKRPKSPPDESGNYSKKSKEALLLIEHAAAAAVPDNAAATGGNYKLFSELEAICKPGSGGGGGTAPNINQTGSGSALTGDDDDNPLLPECAPCPAAIDCGPDHGSDSSRGGDAQPAPPSSTNRSQKGSSGSSSRRKQRAKRRQQEQISVVTAFFESLVKQVMDHQESLHCKFLQVMERRDQERAGREEAWRRQEAARNAGKAASRAQERALAASREAAIVSFLEKITGEALNLPQFPVDEPRRDQECNALELYNNADGGGKLNSSRWPKAEVQALIRVRSGLETKFQEPGLKGPLWEEVSSTMASMGYRRSAKRCKEKWGEHQQVLPEDEGQRQEAAAALQDLPLLPPARPALRQVVEPSSLLLQCRRQQRRRRREEGQLRAVGCDRRLQRPPELQIPRYRQRGQRQRRRCRWRRRRGRG
ncbi:putative trihelix transcription factor GTL1 [Iris pallida]|uniref:Trihelix transcription factor GTL1 n=1 Tax=Iris pallida TaxID=29817 RepID=A0AAX6HCU1_IRIPA|nr:putative trihelix transcription factor GTL1 [Iris pallida]